MKKLILWALYFLNKKELETRQKLRKEALQKILFEELISKEEYYKGSEVLIDAKTNRCIHEGQLFTFDAYNVTEHLYFYLSSPDSDLATASLYGRQPEYDKNVILEGSLRSAFYKTADRVVIIPWETPLTVDTLIMLIKETL